MKQAGEPQKRPTGYPAPLYGSMCDLNKKKLSYTVQERKANGSFIIWEHEDGCAVNEYIAYDRGQTFTLYPRRKLMPSTVPLRKQTISIFDTRRAY
jgi:hypothetical protein